MSPILRGVVVALFFSLVLGCKKEVPSPALGELVAAEKAFAQMGADKGIREAFLAFFADDGISFEPHPVKTKESLSKRPAPTGPRTLLVEWEPTYADVSRSGELGYTTGPSVLTDLSPQKKAPQYGTYFSIWRKQADGAWKVLLDLGTDGPGGPPAEPRAFRAAPPSGWAAGPGTTNLESRRASLMEVDRQFASGAEARGLVNAYADSLEDEARLHRKGAFPLQGKDRIRSYLSERAGRETWQPILADVAQADDLGYTYGSYRFAGATADAEQGYYVRVWRRNARGQWRIALDTQYPVLADEEEAALNREGYRLLAEKNTKEAVRIFEQNVVAHPHSANAHDSLSDAYEAAGDLEKAIELARKALDVLPRDPSKDQALKDRVRASATEKLKRLGHPVSGPR